MLHILHTTPPTPRAYALGLAIAGQPASQRKAAMPAPPRTPAQTQLTQTLAARAWAQSQRAATHNAAKRAYKARYVK